MKRVYILGAGPTGLALAQQLAETAPDLSVIVVERDQSLGVLRKLSSGRGVVFMIWGRIRFSHSIKSSGRKSEGSCRPVTG